MYIGLYYFLNSNTHSYFSFFFCSPMKSTGTTELDSEAHPSAHLSVRLRLVFLLTVPSGSSAAFFVRASVLSYLTFVLTHLCRMNSST